MYRYAIQVEYIGKYFFGWQKQKEVSETIEAILENAIMKFGNIKDNFKIFSSGRTDAGVSALCQIVHFDLFKLYSINNVIRGINFYLKDYSDRIRILDAALVDSNFHARFDCINKTYMYQFTMRNTIHRWNYLFVPKQIEWDRFYLFIGTHDFKNLVDRKSRMKDTVRNIHNISIVKEDDIVKVFITAKGFLHNQVRYIVGSVIHLELEDFFNIKPKIAPPEPLYLYSVCYNNDVFLK